MREGVRRAVIQVFSETFSPSTFPLSYITIMQILYSSKNKLRLCKIGNAWVKATPCKERRIFKIQVLLKFPASPSSYFDCNRYARKRRDGLQVWCPLHKSGPNGYWNSRPKSSKEGERKPKILRTAKDELHFATLVKAFSSIKKDGHMLKTDPKRTHLMSPILHLKITVDGKSQHVLENRLAWFRIWLLWDPALSSSGISTKLLIHPWFYCLLEQSVLSRLLSSFTGAHWQHLPLGPRHIPSASTCPRNSLTMMGRPQWDPLALRNGSNLEVRVGQQPMSTCFPFIP